MVLILAIVISVIVGFATGGSLANVAHLRIRYLPLLIGALLVQIAIFTPLLGTRAFIHEIGPYLYVATLAVTLAVMLMNLQIPGMQLIALGAFLNALVISANGGFMPSPESALREADRLKYVECEQRDDDCVLTNSTIADDDTRLYILGDVIPIPKEIPFANVISIGDIILAVGAGIAVITVMRRRPTQPEATTEEQAEPTAT